VCEGGLCGWKKAGLRGERNADEKVETQLMKILKLHIYDTTYSL